MCETFPSYVRVCIARTMHTDRPAPLFAKAHEHDTTSVMHTLYVYAY